jgi:hypothetical protein
VTFAAGIVGALTTNKQSRPESARRRRRSRPGG